MTSNLIIVGAGDFGREVEVWLRDINKVSPTWKVAGFLDANPHALDGLPTGLSILGDPATYEFRKNDCAVVAIADPATRQKVVASLTGRVLFASVVHPTARIAPYSIIGQGAVLCPNVIICVNAKVGNHVHINVSTIIGHDAVLEDFVTICPTVNVSGAVVVEEGAFLGTQAVLLPRSKVGRFARVGAGTVVLHRVAAETSVFGVPSRRYTGPLKQ